MPLYADNGGVNLALNAFDDAVGTLGGDAEVGTDLADGLMVERIDGNAFFLEQFSEQAAFFQLNGMGGTTAVSLL